jgi:folylpolyglutamate synthase/dihydropteroate synthase
MEAEQLVALAHQAGTPAQAIVPLEDALVRALEWAGSVSAVVVAGSIFVAAAAREVWSRLPMAIRSANGVGEIGRD